MERATIFINIIIMNTGIAANMVATVGNTPLIRLNKLAEGLGAEVCVKAEFFNPLFPKIWCGTQRLWEVPGGKSQIKV